MSEINNSNSEQSLNDQIIDEIDVSEVMQVPIDDTLSISGEAADAKAVGDALALKADKSDIQTQVRVNGQSADAQGLILVDATDVPMSSTDSTTVAAKISEVDGKTAEDIPVSDETGAQTIAEALASGVSRTADMIPMSAADTRTVKAVTDALTSGLNAVQQTVAALDEKTAANIPYEAGSQTTIKGKVDEIDAAAVRTVNEVEPDADGNVEIERVRYADNFWTEDNQQTAGTFLRRTTGGGISLSDGDATAIRLMGNRVHEGYVAESLQMTVTPIPRPVPAAITATLDSATYIAYVVTAGTQTLSYTTDWSEDPSLYGVAVSNEPVSGDSITLTWDGESDPVMTVSAVERTAPDGITAEIDRDTFVAYVDVSGTTTLYYTTNWSADPALYGITVTGEPVSGDMIRVVYVKEVRGTITQATPTRLVGTGWNIYEASNGYARVIRYSDQYGYRIGGTYTGLVYATDSEGTDAESITPDANGCFSVPGDGYVIVTGGGDDTYILSTWSDWTTAGTEGTYQTYTEDAIDISGIMTANLPYGLCRAGDVRDEINLSDQVIISRILRVAYSAEARAAAEASGLAYEYDENYIYQERATAITTSISLDNLYAVSEHGFEYVDGTGVPIYAEIFYGQNLKDKLRRISAQTVPMVYGQSQTVAEKIAAMDATAAAQGSGLAAVQGGLAYVERGDTIAANANYTAGKFICWQGEIYRIITTINATVTSSNWTTYLAKQDGIGGALSQINADITSLNSNLTGLTTRVSSVTTGYDATVISECHYLQINGTVQVDIKFKNGMSNGWHNDIVTGLPAKYRPFYSVNGCHRIGAMADATNSVFATLSDDGTVQVYNSTALAADMIFSFTYPYNWNYITA